MAREVEAILKLQAKLGNVAAFGAMARKIEALEAKTRQANRVQAIMNRTSAAYAKVAGVIGPAIIAAGAARSIKDFAAVEMRLTRIAITAGEGKGAVAGMMQTINDTAQKYAMSQDQVTSGLETLISAGMSAKDAMSFLPAVTATAQAAGAGIDDIAATAHSIGDAFDITGAQMQSAFDILVTGGKQGQFELKDMASYLPSLAPQFAALGYKGTEGLAKLTAILQTIRKQTGESGEAATDASNIFNKMLSQETAKKFSKFGIDLPKALNKARKEGNDLVDVFLDLTQEATKGDAMKLPLLFTDAQFLAGMRALLDGRDALKGFQDGLRSVNGATTKDLNVVLSQTDAKIQQLSNSWTDFETQLGATIAPPAIAILQNLTENLQRERAIVTQLMREGHSWLDANTRLGYDRAEDDAVLVRARDYDAQMEYQASRAAGAVMDVGGDLLPLPKGKTGKQSRITPKRGAPLPGARPAYDPDAPDDSGFAGDLARQDAQWQVAYWRDLSGIIEDRDSRDLPGLVSGTEVADTIDRLLAAAPPLEDRATRERPPAPSWRDRIKAANQRPHYDRVGIDALSPSDKIILAEMARSKALAVPEQSSQTIREQAIAASDKDVFARQARGADNAGTRMAADAQADELRQAFEGGGKAVSDGGDHAGQAISDSAQQLADAVTRAFASGAQSLAAAISSALSQGVKVNVNAQGGTLSGRAVGRSMLDAGTPASGAEGSRKSGAQL